MSIDTVIALPAADVPAELPTSQAVLMAEYDDGVVKQAYLVTDYNALDWPVSTYIVGAWDNEQTNDQGYLQSGQTFDVDGTTVLGTPTHALASDYVAFIRPLGNDAGRATGLLDSVRWQGHSEGKFLADANRYTPADAPFTLEIIRQDYGSTAQPWDNGVTYQTGEFATSGGMWMSLQDNNTGNTPFGGSPFWEFINQSGPWGWVVQMLSDDPLRDITARAVGIYTDPEATIFEYTTGAFINDGKYGDVFYTECPPGNRIADPDQVNFALLLGSAQEGFMNLPVGVDGETNTSLYWAADQ
jgi:hypothetical protein